MTACSPHLCKIFFEAAPRSLCGFGRLCGEHFSFLFSQHSSVASFVRFAFTPKSKTSLFLCKVIFSYFHLSTFIALKYVNCAFWEGLRPLPIADKEWVLVTEDEEVHHQRVVAVALAATEVCISRLDTLFHFWNGGGRGGGRGGFGGGDRGRGGGGRGGGDRGRGSIFAIGNTFSLFFFWRRCAFIFWSVFSSFL